MKKQPISHQPLRGFRDLLPPESEKISYVVSIVNKHAKRYGFEEVITPIVEDIYLFKRGVGNDSDIVSKEMFSFSDHDKTVVLRPEGTCGVVRAMIDNKDFHRRVCYYGPFFRRERPQRGRYRQFLQFGCEIVGDSSIYQDIECLQLLIDIFNELKVKFTIKINNIGKIEDRKKYEEHLAKYLKSNYEHLSDDSKTRVDEGRYFRVLDSKEDHHIIVSAPDIKDFISDESRFSYQEIISYLNSISSETITYIEDKTLVRGLDYYNDLVYEFTSHELGSKNSIAGGGRYDNLFEDFGYPNPATGFAIGIDRVAEIVNISENLEKKIGVIIVEPIYPSELLSALRKKYVVRVVTCNSYKKVGDFCQELYEDDYRYAIICGEEVRSKQVTFKDLISKEQKLMSFKDIITIEL